MAFLKCDFMSEALGMQTQIQVTFPEKADMSKLKVVYLLHGLSDNASCWQRFAPVELCAREHNIAIVMPEVQRSFYADMKYGLKYFTYVREELPQFCERTFGFSPAAENRFVMGLSMGGYGALKCALTQPFKYAGVGAFSSVACVDFYTLKDRVQAFSGEWYGITGGEEITGSENDLRALADKAAAAKNLPEIYITCGLQDDLLDMNRVFDKHLTGLSINHAYEEWEGAHYWTFWQQSLLKACDKFFGK